MGGISITQLLIIGSIVVLLFGTEKLRTLGSDLGASIKGFKKSMNDDDHSVPPVDTTPRSSDFRAPFFESKTGQPVADKPKHE